MRHSAVAPATVANVAVGFDILGFAIKRPHDKVSVDLADEGVEILSISGTSEALPLAPEKNTAGAALLEMIRELGLDFGFSITIEKGIPLASGLGGSAASAVAAVTAANATLDEPLGKDELLRFALKGESVASGGSLHGDNVAPALFGGLTMCLRHESKGLTTFDVVPLPSPDFLVLMIHPDSKVETKEARSILSPTVPLQDHVQQSMNLAKFISCCYTKDFRELKSYMKDVIIERQRAHLIPHFDSVKTTLAPYDPLVVSISGAGPSIFAFFTSSKSADEASRALSDVHRDLDVWVTEIDRHGSVLIDDQEGNPP